MKRRINHKSLFVLAIVGMFTMACGPSVQVTSRLAIDETDCNAAGASTVEPGLLDLESLGGYDATVSATAQGTTNIDGARVWIADQAGNPMPNLPEEDSQREPVLSATVTNAETSVLIPALTANDAEQLRLRLVGVELTVPQERVRIRVSFTLQSGGAPVSDTFSFPIDLCAGCLITEVCPAGSRYSTCKPGQDNVAVCVTD